MKILLLTDEVWNDRIHGNNVLSNWFNGFPGEFAQIYCSPGLPLNNCCKRYFQITDGMMIRSLLKRVPAGKIVNEMEHTAENYVSTDVGHIGWMRKYCGNVLRFLKSVVWSVGKYDEESLAQFVRDFEPDIIFAPRMATPKMLRLERIVCKYVDCPMVAFTGDNEYSLRMFSFSPFAWINKFWTRNMLRRNSSMYSLYYTLSDEQKEEYERVFTCPVKILRKCASERPKERLQETSLHNPIQLVYAGKLYCNRWKTLSQIGKALFQINKETTKFQLDIYTKDTMTQKQKNALDYPGSVYVHGPISQQDVLDVYSMSDIALHIESFDIANRLSTRVSFSTKIIDCLSCGCAVMAVAWREHSGLTYLKKEDAAICVDDCSKIKDVLMEFVNCPENLQKYKSKAISCLLRNHSRNQVQNMLLSDLNEILTKEQRIL